MPEIPVGSQIFDVLFHPTSAIAYTGLLSGHIKAFAYGEQGQSHNLFALRPSRRSCRGLSINSDGSKLYAVGKSKALHIIDTATTDIDARSGAHDCSINRVKYLMPWTVATGDDDGTVKLWDLRTRDSVKTYTQHFDYISDFLWLNDKKQLVATSGDGTLSVMDVRAKERKAVAQSEDQEDDLLSVVAIKKGQKILVGTQLGMVSVFNRKKGWGDCVDRIPGHPLSIDALCNIPDDFPDTDPTSTVLTGSSDGFVRSVQILPTKFLGVLVDHGEFPVERIAIGNGVGRFSQPDERESNLVASHASKIGVKVGADEEAAVEEYISREKRWWVGSVGHDEALHMTDLAEFFHDKQEDSDKDFDDDEEWTGIDRSADTPHVESAVKPDAGEGSAAGKPATLEGSESDWESDEEEEVIPPPVKRKRTEEQGLGETKKLKKGKQQTVVDAMFFDGL